jgi:dihydropteroate synthase
MRTMASHVVRWRVGSRTLECGRRTLVMGVINVTPDSFSDGGRFLDHRAAVAAGIKMVQEGADLLDVGGESTRPGSNPVPPPEERDRVLPVIERLAAEVDVPVSVDTRRAEVAESALDAGATVVNDVTAGSDPRMFDVVRRAGSGMVLMHMRGDPKTMQQQTAYRDVVGEVHEHLRGRVWAAIEAGIDGECLAVDPGLGFAKTADGSLLLMRHVERFLDLDRPIVIGPSRKSFIGVALGGLDVSERLEGTAGAVAWLAGRGAHVVRVHDVREMVRVVRVVDAIRRAGQDGSL